MSGIYGAWQAANRIKEYEMELNRLQGWNLAYGTDAAQRYVNEAVWLGCSYEKLSEAAPKSTPVMNRQGKYAVIDALLYNRQELMEKGGFSDALSDEKLLWAWIDKYGLDELKQVNGDFTGAIYEEETGTMTLFRDHMGVRPLYYYVDSEVFAFSTDIRGLVSMQCIDASVDENWLWDIIVSTATFGTENTEFAHIFCVKPASYMTFSLDSAQPKSVQTVYWQPGRKKIRLSSEEEYRARLRELITDSVKRRLDAVPELVGAELSGGLDSGVIDILIHRLGREAMYFSWSADPKELPYAEEDERLVVEDICKQEGVACHYRGSSVSFAEDSIINQKMRRIGIEPDLSAGFYRRYVFPPYVNTLQIGQAAQYVNSCGAKVVFTGHGGDEGVSHRCNPYELFYHREYLHYFKYMWDSTRGEKKRIYKTVIRSHKNLTVSRKQLTGSFVGAYASKDMLKKEFYEKYEAGRAVAVPFAYDPLTYIKNGGSRNRLDVVALLGAYCGARYLVPYLDYRVIDYAVSIPRHLYLKHQTHRYLFREAFKDMMPESLYNLKGKEDTSWRNIEKKEKDSTAYLERKKRLLSMLDRAYWDRYLDWEVLEKWAELPLEAADEAYDRAMLAGIDNCLSHQNLITFSRTIDPKTE